MQKQRKNYQYKNIYLIKYNTYFYTNSCQASTVALSTAIAMMLQRQPRHVDKSGAYKVKVIIQDAYGAAEPLLETPEKVGTHKWILYV